MRKAIPKSIRKIVYKKYNGHCAYCGSCNRYKATMDLETFRKELQKIPDRLKRDICTYNIALRYGMVQEKVDTLTHHIKELINQYYQRYIKTEEIIPELEKLI